MADLPNGVSHYEHLSEVPHPIRKYWHQRYQILSRYDEGVWLTDDAWFGITPEPVAQTIATHLTRAAPPEKRILIDAFAGVGGNTIAFAQSDRWDTIFAVEKNPDVLTCAKHNAEIYGVNNKIWWIEGDIFEVMKTRLRSVRQKAVIFASPPWGGPGYRDDDVFDITQMQPYGLQQLCDSMFRVTNDVVLYLPRTSDLNQIAKHVPGGQQGQVIHYCMDGASKALCIYYGAFQEICEGRN